MTWLEIAEDSWLAANELSRTGRGRSSVSRAYYSAYSFATGALTNRGLRFSSGRQGPAHASLPKLVADQPGFKLGKSRELRKAFMRLYAARVQADYFLTDIPEADVRAALRDAFFVRAALK